MLYDWQWKCWMEIFHTYIDCSCTPTWTPGHMGNRRMHNKSLMKQDLKMYVHACRDWPLLPVIYRPCHFSLAGTQSFFPWDGGPDFLEQRYVNTCTIEVDVSIFVEKGVDRCGRMFVGTIRRVVLSRCLDRRNSGGAY